MLNIFHRLVFYALLLAPISVYWLPRFQTLYSEDLLLLGLWIYMLLRFLNPRRLKLGDRSQIVIISTVLAAVYAIGWLGLLRSYITTHGGWLAAYPLWLIVTALLRPKPIVNGHDFHQTVITILCGFTLLMLLSLGFAYAGIEDTSPLSIKTLIGPMLIVVLPVSAALFCRSVGQLNSAWGNFILLLTLSLSAAIPWYKNVGTFADWHKAGELERAWTPYRFRDQPQKKQAEQKPLQALRYYQRVYERIMNKGELPHYLNWPFFLRYRMAYQAMRLKNPPLCAAYLPVGSIANHKKIQLVKNLWHPEFITHTQFFEPQYQKEERAWTDFEKDTEDNIIALDRWGRVYRKNKGVFYIDWKAPSTFADAIDLEIHRGDYYVVRESGVLITSATNPIVDFNALTLSPPLIDLEFSHDGRSAFVADAFGAVTIIGVTPESFPDLTQLRFEREVIVDFELDPDGRGYYLLDHHGAVHAKHENGAPSLPYRSPPIPQGLAPYWPDQAMAVDLEIDAQHRGLYVYTRTGEIFSIAQHPYMETYRPDKPWPYRGMVLKSLVDGSLRAFESNGQEVLIDIAP